MKDPQLQGLRGIAIVMVAVFHFTVRWDSQNPGGASLYPFGDWFQPAAPLLYQGRLGVELFFIISGYVISLTLERSVGLRDFWLRRFVRLWPPLLVALPIAAAFLAMGPALEKSSASPLALLESLTLIDPTTLDLILPGAAATGQTTGVLWSLWIELQFYAVASVLFFTCRHKFLPALCVAAVLWQVIGLLPVLGEPIGAPYGTYSLSYYFWWFVAGAVFFEIRKVGTSAYLWALVGVSWFASSSELSMDPTQPIWIGIGVNTTFFAVFTLIASEIKLRWLAWAPLVWLGNLSYEFYLIHEAVGMSILQLLRSAGVSASPLWSLTPWLVCLPLSWIIYRYWSTVAADYLKPKLAARQQTQ